MRLVLISDTHCHQDFHVPDGDALVHAGDTTGSGTRDQVRGFLDWFAAQPHRHKIFIAGNHDWLFQRDPAEAARLIQCRPGLAYLEDAELELEGIRFWGSPWQPEFCDWAFNLPRKGEALRRVWSRIPPGTDVLITHGPPYGVLDQVGAGEHLGCEELRARLAAVRPRLHVFGHIHDGHGVATAGGTVCVNASVCDERYRPVHPPIVVDLTAGQVKVLAGTPRGRMDRLDALRASLLAPKPPGR